MNFSERFWFRQKLNRKLEFENLLITDVRWQVLLLDKYWRFLILIQLWLSWISNWHPINAQRKFNLWVEIYSGSSSIFKCERFTFTYTQGWAVPGRTSREWDRGQNSRPRNGRDLYNRGRDLYKSSINVKLIFFAKQEKKVSKSGMYFAERQLCFLRNYVENPLSYRGWSLSWFYPWFNLNLFKKLSDYCNT